MIEIQRILKKLSSSYKRIVVNKYDMFEFSNNNAYLILNGSILCYDHKNLTQLLKNGDPIGFSEIIIAQKKKLKYRILTDLELIEFSGSDIRDQVNQSHLVVKSIIKYSLARIFGNTKSKSHFLLEDEYIQKNRSFFNKLTFYTDQKVFITGQVARSMYYIETGSISIFTRNNRHLVDLIKSEAFGESALIKGSNRNNTAIANQNSDLIAINAETLSKQVYLETPLVQLTLLCVLTRLELMNKLRMADDFRKQ